MVTRLADNKPPITPPGCRMAAPKQGAVQKAPPKCQSIPATCCKAPPLAVIGPPMRPPGRPPPQLRADNDRDDDASVELRYRPRVEETEEPLAPEVGMSVRTHMLEP